MTIFIQAWGSGNKDKRGYLLPVDGEPDYPEFTAYPLELWLITLKNSQLKQCGYSLIHAFQVTVAMDGLQRTSWLSIEIRMPKIPKKIIVVSAASK